MEVLPEQPTAKGPAEWFTGDVWIDSITRGEEPSRVRVSAVRFTPAARTAWHSHAVGQTLYVTEGRGRLQSRGGDIAEIRPGSARSPGRARPSRRSPRPGSTASRRGTRST